MVGEAASHRWGGGGGGFKPCPRFVRVLFGSSTRVFPGFLLVHLGSSKLAIKAPINLMVRFIAFVRACPVMDWHSTLGIPLPHTLCPQLSISPVSLQRGGVRYGRQILLQGGSTPTAGDDGPGVVFCSEWAAEGCPVKSRSPDATSYATFCFYPPTVTQRSFYRLSNPASEDDAHFSPILLRQGSLPASQSQCPSGYFGHCHSRPRWCSPPPPVGGAPSTG